MKAELSRRSIFGAAITLSIVAFASDALAQGGPALERCRETVGRPIVQACMQAGGKPGGLPGKSPSAGQGMRSGSRRWRTGGRR